MLCYTTAALAEDLEVTGPVRLELFGATDGPDTDWTAKLVDVDPHGAATNLCDGILRAGPCVRVNDRDRESSGRCGVAVRAGYPSQSPQSGR